MMKKIFFIFFIFFSFISFSQNSDWKNEISKANNFYKEKKFKKAVEIYENLIKQDFESSELYYNLGNSYYKIGEIASAILNFERAKLLAPNDDDIKNNLLISQKSTKDKNEKVPQLLIFVWAKNLIKIFHFETWATISVIFSFLFLSLFTAFLLSNKIKMKKLFFFISVLFLIISLKSFIFAHYQNDMQINHKQAIIFAPSVEIKSEPSEMGTILFPLHEGTKVLVLDEENNWLEIKISDGRIGWIQKKDLEII